MTTSDPSDLEAQIDEWRAYTARHRVLRTADADELEDHLRDRIEDLVASGLSADEAFLVAVKRMGSLDAVTREFAREHSDRLWKQLVLTGPDGPDDQPGHRDLAVVLAVAAAAAVLVKLPTLFGLDLETDAGFYARNLGLFATLPLAGLLAWRRGVGPGTLLAVGGLFALAAVGANAYRLDEESSSFLLSTLHLPIALWLVVGVAYVGGDWRSGPRRMDFIRFSGEWFIYFVLIALGGGVLTGITAAAFSTIDVDLEVFLTQWLVPCGAAGAVVVAGWLVEAKQSVIENMAPVLTRVFTPLFVLTLLAFVGGLVATGTGIDVDRDVLILFDLVLVVVVGLLLYGISARDEGAAATLFDRLLMALVAAALVVDSLVLVAIVGRISDFGFSANKTAALGENLVLLGNLAVSAWLLLGFLRGRSRFARLEAWQTRYLTVYAAWAWFVVLVFPVLFGGE